MLSREGKMRTGRTSTQTSPENTPGIDPRLFNFIFCLITGKAASVSDYMDVDINGKVLVRTHNIKVWDCPEGIKFFKWFLFG